MKPAIEFTPRQLATILKMNTDGFSKEAIAARFNCNQSTIKRIIKKAKAHEQVTKTKKAPSQ